MKNIVILGATSAIAKEWSRLEAKEKSNFILAGRNKEKLEILKSDLLLRGASSAEIYVFEANDSSKHKSLCQKILKKFNEIDVVMFAQGEFPSQIEIQDDSEGVERIFQTNMLSIVSVLSYLVPFFEKQKRGTITAISSVAGDRGRGSNYIYGSSKAALSEYMSGLAQRLNSTGVQVLTIKPGTIDTPMTAGLKKNFLWGSAEGVAMDIDKAIRYKKSVLYTPWYWWGIMWIIKLIPEWLFKRLKF